jgi:hypothetical protein
MPLGMDFRYRVHGMCRGHECMPAAGSQIAGEAGTTLQRCLKQQRHAMALLQAQTTATPYNGVTTGANDSNAMQWRYYRQTTGNVVCACSWTPLLLVKRCCDCTRHAVPRLQAGPAWRLYVATVAAARGTPCRGYKIAASSWCLRWRLLVPPCGVDVFVARTCSAATTVRSPPAGLAGREARLCV